MAVGSYKRLEEIGRGSFATVYKASQSVSSHPRFPPAANLSLVQHRVLLHNVHALTYQSYHWNIYQVNANALHL